MEGLMDERGQMIVLFAAVAIVVIISIAYLHAQNVIAGMESSRTMLAYPKEEIRNLKELRGQVKLTGGNIGYVNNQIVVLCAQKGWLCEMDNSIVVFKNVEVCYCEKFAAGINCNDYC